MLNAVGFKAFNYLTAIQFNSPDDVHAGQSHLGVISDDRTAALIADYIGAIPGSR